MKGLAGFTKRNRRNCEIFYARHEKTFGATVLAKTVAPKFCHVARQIQQVGGESNSQGFLLVLFFFYFPVQLAGSHIHNSRGKSLAPGCYDNPKVLYMWLLLIQIQTASSLLFFFSLTVTPKQQLGKNEIPRLLANRRLLRRKM